MSDSELFQLMKIVDLEALYKREQETGQGFDTKKSWVDVLSGGERQKISFARVFYHKPMFALLDESSSAVSMDFEHILYKKCREFNITMLTISQRNSLFPFHDYLLELKEDHTWSFEIINHDETEV